MCEALSVLDKLIWLYSLIMVVYAVLSWVPELRGGWSRYIAMVVEPVLMPVRRLVPAAGGIDWSFLIVMVALWLFRAYVIAPQLNRCLMF